MKPVTFARLSVAIAYAIASIGLAFLLVFLSTLIWPVSKSRTSCTTCFTVVPKDAVRKPTPTPVREWAI